MFIRCRTKSEARYLRVSSPSLPEGGKEYNRFCFGCLIVAKNHALLSFIRAIQVVSFFQKAVQYLPSSEEDVKQDASVSFSPPSGREGDRDSGGRRTRQKNKTRSCEMQLRVLFCFIQRKRPPVSGRFLCWI